MSTVSQQANSVLSLSSPEAVVVVSSTKALDLQLEATTIALSFTAESTSGIQGLLSRDASFYTGDGNHLSVFIDNGTLTVRLQDNGDDLVLAMDGITADQDYHLGLSFGEGEAKLYVDGDLVDSGQTDMNWATSPEYLQIGALGWASSSGGDSYSNTFSGEIKDVEIYDQILTEDTIAAMVAPPQDSPVDVVTPEDPQPPTDPVEPVDQVAPVTPADPVPPVDIAPPADTPTDTGTDTPADTGNATDPVAADPDPAPPTDPLEPADPQPQDDPAPVADDPAQDPVLDAGPGSGPGTETGDATDPVAGTPDPDPQDDQAQDPVLDTGSETETDADLDTDPAAQSVAPVYALADTSNVAALAPQQDLQLEATTIALSFTAESTSGIQGLLSRDASFYAGDGNHLSVFIDNGTLTVRLQDNGDDLVLAMDGITAGQDYHLGLSFGEGEAKLYVDGDLVDSGQTDMNWATSPEYLQIGALGWASSSGGDSYSNTFSGEIKDVEIYDQILTEDTIAAMVAPPQDGPVDVVTPEDPQPPTDPVDQVDAVAPVTPADPVPPVDTAPPADTPADTGTDTPADTGNTTDPIAADPVTPTNPVEPADPQPQDDPAPVADDPAQDPVLDAGPGSGPGTETGQTSDPITDIEHGEVLTLDGSVSVSTGRVSTLSHGDEDTISSIRVVDGPDFGNLTVNPDNTLALVLSGTDQTGPLSFSYEVTYDDASTELVSTGVNVTSGSQAGGWAEGDYYLLETDASGRVAVEHGDDHRAVYVTESDNALSRQDIADLEGISANAINGAWLANNPQYGASPDMALDTEAGMQLWYEITGQGQENSNWLLFERGYEYDGHLGTVLDAGTQGESELHPTYIGAWGEGAQPVLDAQLNLYSGGSANIVVQDVELAEGARIIGWGGTNENIIFDDVAFGDIAIVQSSENVTIRNSNFFDLAKDSPSNGSRWDGLPDRVQGIYSDNTDGFLMEGLVFDHVGWEEGYDPNLSGAAGQAPSIYSHSIYVQSNNSDVTLRDSVVMRSASWGAQVRSGGLVEDNVFIDNNAGINTLGGDYLGAGPVGDYTLMNSNVVTSGAHKQTEGLPPGALTMGVVNDASDTTLNDNIITHLADPNNPEEQDQRFYTHKALDHWDNETYYDDTIVYNWEGGDVEAYNRPSQDTNTEGLDPAVLDQTTIQNFIADLLGQETATIDDLSDILKAQANGEIDDTIDADLIVAYFQEGFGIAPDVRQDATTLRFVPDDRADGIRWDNRENWDTEDLPGSVAGDSVDLAGNWVNYGGTTEIEDLTLGAGGALDIKQGKLTVNGEIHSDPGATIDIDNAGQLWVEEYHGTETLDIDVDGGRFANTGFFDGLLDLNVTDGQALLGVDDAVMELGDGSVITVEGDDAKVGFDGQDGGVSVLRMETGSELRMIADGGGFSTIEEVRSGAMEEDTPDVLSAFDMGEGTLLIDIGAIAGGAAREDVLVDTDQIVGMFDDVEFIGLGANQDATLTVDYEGDKVTVALGQAGQGSGQINVATVGNELNAAEDAEIWDALTSLPLNLRGTSSDDILSGGSGDDFLEGRGGADELTGGDGTDWASYESSDDGVFVRLWAGDGAGGDAEGDTLNGIENLLGSRYDDTLVGNDNDNHLVGGNGDDALWGNVGDDILDGGKGADRLHGQSGFDWADYSNSDAGVSVKLWNGQGDGGHADGDSLVAIENLQGSVFADLLVGDQNENHFRGGLGDDALWGNLGDDKLDGGEGSDALFGQDGNDVLLGGLGNDFLIGGEGADRFVFRKDSGKDTIVDFGEGDIVEFQGIESLLSFSDVENNSDFDAQTQSLTISVPEAIVTLQGVTMDLLSAEDFLFV